MIRYLLYRSIKINIVYKKRYSSFSSYNMFNCFQLVEIKESGGSFGDNYY